MPDLRPVASGGGGGGGVETGDGPRSGTGSRDDLARDLAPPWPARLPASTGRPPGRGPAPGSVGGAPAEVFARGLAPPGRGPRSSIEPGTPGPLVIHRSGFARPPGPERTLALADGFGQDRQQSRWLPSGTEERCLTREFFGCRHDPSLRATPSFRDRGAVALRTGPGTPECRRKNGGGGGWQIRTKPPPTHIWPFASWVV